MGAGSRDSTAEDAEGCRANGTTNGRANCRALPRRTRRDAEDDRSLSPAASGLARQNGEFNESMQHEPRASRRSRAHDRTRRAAEHAVTPRRTECTERADRAGNDGSGLGLTPARGRGPAARKKRSCCERGADLGAPTSLPRGAIRCFQPEKQLLATAPPPDSPCIPRRTRSAPAHRTLPDSGPTAGVPSAGARRDHSLGPGAERDRWNLSHAEAERIRT